MTTFSDTFTQGGQTQLHKFRMINQVIGTTLKISLIIGAVFFMGILWYEDGWQNIWFLLTFYKAQFRDSMTFLPKGFFDSSWILHGNRKYYEISDHIISHKKEYVLSAMIIQAHLIKRLLQTFVFMLVSMSLICFFWIRKGKKQKEVTLKSGHRLVPLKELTKEIKKRKLGSDLSLANLPLLKDRETEHMLVVGTTGAGKTNAMNQLLDQVLKRGDKIIIVDTTGGFVNRFYDPDRDIILNPLDPRTKHWNLWEECTEDYLFDEFAESLIPQTGHDPFWSNAARTVLTVAAKKLGIYGEPSVKKLVDIAVSMPLKEASYHFSGTMAASMMDINSEKTASSIRSTLANAIKCFEYLKESDTCFSIRQWVLDHNRTGILFLSCTTEQRSSLRPLLSGWLTLATKAAMSLGEEANSKIWFLIDELPSLNQIPSLPNAMAELRKYGGCFVIGLQNLSQMDELYGNNLSRSICGLTGTKLVFRSPDAHTAKRMCEFLGEQEVIEHSESISFGAHQMRDGVSLAEQRRNKTVIPYTDLLNLPNLQAFIKLPSDLPITKLTFEYRNRPQDEI